MIPTFNSDHLLDRRRFLNLGARGMGALGLASLAQPGLLNAATGRGGGALVCCCVGGSSGPGGAACFGVDGARRAAALSVGG